MKTGDIIIAATLWAVTALCGYFWYRFSVLPYEAGRYVEGSSVVSDQIVAVMAVFFLLSLLAATVLTAIVGWSYFRNQRMNRLHS